MNFGKTKFNISYLEEKNHIGNQEYFKGPFNLSSGCGWTNKQVDFTRRLFVESTNKIVHTEKQMEILRKCDSASDTFECPLG